MADALESCLMVVDPAMLKRFLFEEGKDLLKNSLGIH